MGPFILASLTLRSHCVGISGSEKRGRALIVPPTAAERNISAR